jgi:hypothetical protein
MTSYDFMCSSYDGIPILIQVVRIPDGGGLPPPPQTWASAAAAAQPHPCRRLGRRAASAGFWAGPGRRMPSATATFWAEH